MSEILITSSVLIVVLLALRKLLWNSLSRRVQYTLWGLVLLRLLVPVSLPAVDFSVLTAAKPVEQTVAQRVTARPIYIPVARAPLAEHPTAPDISPERADIPEGKTMWLTAAGETAVQYKRLSIQTVLTWVWLAGSAVAVVWLLTVNVRFWLRLRRSRIPWDVEFCALPVFLVEAGLSSPCLFGLFRPAIYLTPAALASPERLRYVLAHETTHARHLDHLWTLLRGVCLAVYWFDPLVWAASAAAKTDCELACDESTLARLEDTDRIPYGQTLLSLIPVQRSVNPMLAATTMAAGKRQLKDRITRIAYRPRHLIAAAVAAALLAGLVSACTFTGAAATPGTDLPDDSAVRALTGEELRYFNEMYFNGAGAVDDYGYNVYSIRNQFANPINLYEKPEDVNIFELLYCESGTMEFSEDEIRTAFGIEPGYMPCPGYKLTAGDIDRVLTQYTGLSLEKTNKVGLEYFTYLPDYDAYYWAHGDTNYPGTIIFPCGTREESTITLYHNSNFNGPGWYCVTLEEQNGDYLFRSNVRCEKPAIPTPIPAGEADTVIPLDGLEPYEAPAVTMEPHVGDFVDTYENRLENWNIDGHGVVIYRATDGTINAAVRDDDGETVNVFLSGLGEETGMFFFDDLFGHNGFYISYTGETRPHNYGTFVDYFYLTDDGKPVLLARTTNGSDMPMALDLNGDGIDELVTETEIFFQRDGKLYRADLKELAENACPELDYLDYSQWDPYAKMLYISGLGYLDVGRNIFRWLYFDSEQLLLYKQEKSHHDHMVDGAGQYVPDAVIAAAKDYVEREVLAAQPDGTWRHAGYQDEGYPQETYDDWRIDSFTFQGTETVGDVTVDMWTFNYELHTIDPENVVLAGGMYLTEDDWVSPGYPGCDWLFFHAKGEDCTFLWHSMINDMSPDSERFQEYLQEHLAHLGVVSPIEDTSA